MSGVYKVTFGPVTVSALQDLFEIKAATDHCLELISCRIGQSSEEGDAQAEMLPIEIVRGEGSVTVGSGGTDPTPRPTHSGQPAAGAAAGANNTTRMVVGSGALVTMLQETFNVQVGWFYQPPEEEREWASPGDVLTVALPVNPADSLTMYGTLVYKEHGG